MSTFKELRQSMGLTQRQFADLLGITRTQLSMSELGQRILPTHALLKLGNLEIQMAAQTSPRISIELTRQSGIARDFLAKQALKNNRLAAATNAKLEKMRDQHQQYLRALQGITNMLNHLTANGGAREDKLWLEIAEADLLKKMNTCGIAQQVDLQLKIEGYLWLVRCAESKLL